MNGSVLPGEMESLLAKVQAQTERLTRCADALDADGIDQCIQERGEAMEQLSALYRSLKPGWTQKQVQAFAAEYGALEGQAEFARQHLEKICRSCKETAGVLRKGRTAIHGYGTGDSAPGILNRAG